MGCGQSTVNEITNEPKERLAIEIYAEICISSGFDEKSHKVNEFFDTLVDKYRLISKIEQKEGGQGEFYIFMMKSGKKTAIFTNNKTLHPSAIYSGDLNQEHFPQIEAKIKELLEVA